MLQNETNEIGQFIPIHYHFQMLSDEFRMDAFCKAIEKVVKPGCRVVDLGCGTGIMSFFAASRGAHVWAVEFNPSLVFACRKFINENGLSEYVKVVKADAASWMPPEPVDVVICEMLHSALLREKQVQVISAFHDAHYALFKRIPIFIPCATLLGVQPVWQDYDFRGFYAPVPLFQSAYHLYEKCSPVTDPFVYRIVDYDNVAPEPYIEDLAFSFNSCKKVNALRFITKSLLSIDLGTGGTDDWHSQHMVIPLNDSFELEAGQVMKIHFNYMPGDSIEALSSSIKVKIEKSIEESKETLIA